MVTLGERCSSAAHVNPLYGRARLLGLGNRDRKHAIVEARFGTLRIDAFRQGHDALDPSKGTLAQNIALFVLLALLLLLAANDQGAVRDADLDVALVHAG